MNLKREEFLSFYAKHFSTVEINSSFYHIPRQQTVRHWSWFCEEIYEILKKYNAAIVLSDSPKKAKMSVLSFFKEPDEFGRGVPIKTKNTTSSFLETNRLWPYVNINTANFFYLRFHGSKRLFSSSYTDNELKFME